MNARGGTLLDVLGRCLGWTSRDSTMATERDRARHDSSMTDARGLVSVREMPAKKSSAKTTLTPRNVSMGAIDEPVVRTTVASKAARELFDEVRRLLSEAGDPERARGQQAYMKSEMPFHGVTSPEQRKIYRALFSTHVLDTIEAWQEAVMLLWREARFREERYAAIELSGAKIYKDFQVIDVLPMYEEMIVTGAWWDWVDVVAIHRVGPLLQGFKRPMKATIRAWSKSSNLWKRRTAIICQIAAKRQIDLDLLYEVIASNWADKEFFIRKAIGWALRSHAWVDPEEIATYAALHKGDLSGLSYREAVKNIDAETLANGEARALAVSAPSTFSAVTTPAVKGKRAKVAENQPRRSKKQ